MTLSAKGQFTGLMTAVSELNAPPGALRRADNVVIRKPGAIECRQGTRLLQPSFGLFIADTYTNAIEHAGTVVWERTDGWLDAAGALKQYSPYWSSSLLTPAKLREDSFSVAFARGNMYFPHSRGVLRAGAASDTDWKGTGFSAASATIFTLGVGGVTGVIPALYQANYRVVAVRTDENGMLVRGRPSGAWNAKNEQPFGFQSASVTIVYQPSVGGVKPDYVEVYRTRFFPNTVAVDDEMMLVGTVQTPSTVPDFVTFVDNVTDAMRGVALYTSPSRGGIENANDAPPACAFLEPYRGHMFFGNISGQHRRVASFDIGDQTGSTTGIGGRYGTCNATNGSPTLTSVSPVTGLEIGMTMNINGDDSYYITNIVGTTVTLDKNVASGGGVAVYYQAMDAIWLNGLPATVAYSGAPGRASLILPSRAATRTFGYSTYMVTPSITGKEHTAVIEATNAGGSSFTITATHGSEYEPPIPQYGTTAEDSTNDVYPNGLIYSEPDQPEHVPPKNFMLIGEKSKAILGLAATRDSLFIFKEDGIWRLTGINGNWRVDPFDMTTFCVLPSSIKKMDNRIYMLSNKGVVRVSEVGIELLSSPIADVVAKLVDDCIANEQDLGYYKLTGMDGQAATVDGRNNEYRLLVGTNEMICGGQELVYNARTNAWTTFSYRASPDDEYRYLDVIPTGLATGLQNTPLVLHTGGAREPDYRDGPFVSTEPYIRASDGQLGKTITVAAPIGTAIYALTTSSFGEPPDEGDLMVIGDYALEVTSVVGSTIFVQSTNANAGQPPAGEYTVFRALQCTVQPHGFSAPVFAGKFWSQILVAVSRFRGPFKASIDYTSALPLDTETSQVVEEAFVLPGAVPMWPFHQGSLLRQIVPRSHARAWLLRPTLKWSMAYGESVLESIAVEERESIPRAQQNSTGEG